jgi:hypothetical protein
MASTFQPFGLKPVYHPSGLDRAVPFVGTNSYAVGGAYSAPYSLSSGQAFYQYTPVSLTASGQLTLAATSATGGSAGTVYGVFDGVEFTDSQGRRSVAKWASKLTLDASTEIVFWIFADPALVYEAQVNGSATTAYIGRQYDFDATNNAASGTSIGNGGAGFSTTALASAPVATTVQGQVRVVGLGREVAFPAGETNAWGDDYTIVQVQIANNTFVAPKGSI